MSYEVVIAPTALRQFSALVEWWSENRPDSQTDLIAALERAIVHLRDAPHTGPKYALDARYLTYRIAKTPYFLFYRVDDERRRVNLVAAWSGQRADQPDLP